ncbi:MAG TPA: TVP38/TMEM64 family protein [Clostridiaceae bacterium]|nr:TVP38/TMEM64 family protein [Clostridiaceae bacterium]
MKTSHIVISLSAVVLLGCILYIAWPFLSAFGNPERVREMIVEAGAWGPLIFILMQIVQVFFAPIPGQVVGLIGGYLFGPFWGVVYTIIGATIGFTLIFVLVRKLGRPFVEHFVSQRALKKFDHFANEKGVMVFFLIFLLPAFPDDIISFIAGLTTIKISKLILVSLVGRLPGYVILCLTGNGLAYENINFIIATLAVLAILLAVAWWKRKWLYEFVKHKDRISFLKEHWKSSKTAIILWTLGLLTVTTVIYLLAAFIPISN